MKEREWFGNDFTSNNVDFDASEVRFSSLGIDLSNRLPFFTVFMNDGAIAFYGERGCGFNQCGRRETVYFSSDQLCSV